MRVIDFHCKKLANSQVCSPYTGNEGKNGIKLTKSLAEKLCHFLAQFIHLSKIILAHLSYALDFIICATTWQNQQNECAPSEDSDQPGHPPSLIRVFTVRMKKPWVLSYPLSAQQRLWSDLADAQADLSLRWAHTHFVGFVMSRLICCLVTSHTHDKFLALWLVLSKCAFQKWKLRQSFDIRINLYFYVLFLYNVL